MRCVFYVVITATVLVTTDFALADQKEARREQAISVLRKSGVKVDRDETKPQQPVTRVFFGCHRAPGSLLQELKYIPEVQVMNLRLKQDVSNRELECLQSLGHLTELLIHHCPIRDESLVHLKKLQNIRKLQFASTPITDEGLRHLAELKDLEYLQVGGNGVTDGGVTHLKKLTKLQVLRLDFTSVSEDGLNTLRLSLPNTAITYRPLERDVAKN